MANRNRDKGNGYERQIVQELKEIGFQDVGTSRLLSKATDDNKIDLVFQNKSCPLNIQIKKTTNTPQYFKIRSESTEDPKKFCLIWNKQVKKTKNFGSEGECVIMDKSLFYELIKNKYIMASSKNPNLCVVTFDQMGSKIKISFEEKDGQINFKTDESKFDKENAENLALSRGLANFFLSTLISYYKQEQVASEQSAEQNIESETSAENK